MHGVLRVVMEPLLGDMPLVGALSLFFLKKPVSPDAEKREERTPLNAINPISPSGG